MKERNLEKEARSLCVHIYIQKFVTAVSDTEEDLSCRVLSRPTHVNMKAVQQVEAQASCWIKLLETDSSTVYPQSF